MKKKSHDDAQEDLVRLYLNEIGQHELLTKADEERLGRAIEVGHEAGEALLTTPKLTPARKRELKAVARAGERATRQRAAFSCKELAAVFFVLRCHLRNLVWLEAGAS